MSDLFHPISMEQLTAWAFTELEGKATPWAGRRRHPFLGDRARVR